jgi:hypothetical protein
MKKILLLMIVVFLTGCQAEYTIDIDKELNFTEKISVLKPNSDYENVKQEVDDIVEVLNGTASSYDGYTILPIYGEEKSGYSMELRDSFNSITSSSKILSACYDEIRMNKVDSLITIQTIGNYKCSDYYDKNFLVKIKTAHDVIYTNSDYKEDDYYVWNIDPKADTQKVYIEMNFVEKVDIEPTSSYLLFMIFSLGILFIAFLMYNLIKINGKRNNKL